MQAEQEEPEVSIPEAQWTQCRKLWAEAFRLYLKDCKDVWTKPESKHDPEALAALNDLLSVNSPQLKRICDHLSGDMNPAYVKRIFIRWIQQNSTD
ncbi:hypothetical protein [Nitrincola sp.]|uniref:hypothetical protein n=1 Tax=Nitrincola sp. TaxID=1926584 RepID=UPI003A8F7C82